MPATTRRAPSRLTMIDGRDLAARFAECRSMGHEWKHRKPVGVDDRLDGFRRPFGMSTGMVGFPSTCATCGTRRVRWITRSGEVVTRYEHPEGYSRHGDDRLTSAEWRRSYVGSIFEDYLDHGTRAVAK